MSDLVCQVREFLHQRWDQKSPLFLGYSGGPDSRVLLDILLEAGVNPHLAHVDHGWREESAREAKELQREAEALGLVFHTIRLEPNSSEAVCREKRLEFFLELWEKYSFQALFLGHQADDAAETSLKRVLEGAHLVYLGGMRTVSEWKGMPIWRPLLEVSRREIIAYVEQKKLKVISDQTNFNPAYLRARMRLEILPSLASSFGKEIGGNLALLGRRAFELKDYLDRKTDEAFSGLKKESWGWVLPCLSTEPVEVRHLLQRLKIPFTRDVLEGLVDALVRKAPNRRFNKVFLADRGSFFYFKQTIKTKKISLVRAMV